MNVRHTKLTLRIEAPVIRAAKKYSKKHGKSLSQLVSDYFILITEMSPPSLGEPKPLPPITQSLKGVLRNKKIGVEDYKKYLADKYL